MPVLLENNAHVKHSEEGGKKNPDTNKRSVLKWREGEAYLLGGAMESTQIITESCA